MLLSALHKKISMTGWKILPGNESSNSIAVFSSLSKCTCKTIEMIFLGEGRQRYAVFNLQYCGNMELPFG